MNMMTYTDEMELLDDLVRTNLDVQAAFTVCAHKSGNEQLCAMLLARALVCGQAARELAEKLSAHGCEIHDDVVPKKGNTPDWVALQSALSAHDDDAVRDECARTEDETLVRFRDALEQELPADIRRSVQNHFAALLQYCGRLRALPLPPSHSRESAAAAPMQRSA